MKNKETCINCGRTKKAKCECWLTPKMYNREIKRQDSEKEFGYGLHNCVSQELADNFHSQ